MDNTKGEAETSDEKGDRDWILVGIGILTVGTGLAAAATAGAIAVVGESDKWGSVLIAWLPVAAVVVSLLAYCVVVVTSLATVFREFAADQEREIKLSAIALYFQVFALVVFAISTIVGPLFETG